jgi:post-segregation antitoxin (ccd killing protein)
MDGAAITSRYFDPHTGDPEQQPGGERAMVTISVSSRSLAAARAVDPNVSAAAVRAAIEVALEEQRRELLRRTERPAPPKE